MSKPPGYIVLDVNGQPEQDSYGSVLMFKTVEDARLVLPYGTVKPLIAAKVPRKKSTKSV